MSERQLKMSYDEAMSKLFEDPEFNETVENVMKESITQVSKWGEQDHPSFPAFTYTNDPQIDALRRAHHYGVLSENAAKDELNNAFRSGNGTYGHIFIEEVCEAIGAEDGDKLIEELTQVAAVCVNWIRAIKRRQSNGNA